ncbi:MAG: ectonucleotide pyrophosphatase/phosphodiesterase [Bacteroidales bacterium]|nr:ectonucleotide pyrophosphatase/phosphodiesterase [Bacteroidales bacterium]
MRYNVFLVAIIVLFVSSCNSIEKEQDKPYVVMLSLDGFRWDYPDKMHTPNLDYIQKIGVKAEASIPCFPTKTFPNHYSMATGLYPDNHGLVQNKFYAPDIDKYFSIRNRNAVEDSEFYFGEPIWVTAEKQGVKSASYFWVGSETAHDSIFPSYYHLYNDSVPFERRMQGVIDWLKLPEEKRPHLILLYVQEPDRVGHVFGPDHANTYSMVRYLDSLVGVLNDKIANLPIADKINVIVTSDHGMGAISKEKTNHLFDIVNQDWCEYVDGGNPVFSIEAKDQYYDTLYSLLLKQKGITVWKKEDLPRRLNYGKSLRVKDFVVVADSAWSLLKYSDKKAYSGGTHGYDNKNKDMHAIFYAYGPAFKKGYVHTTINNIDIYPLICDILKLNPAKIDGNFKNVEALLEK